MILALDLARRTGFAHDGDDGSRPRFGTFTAPEPTGTRATGRGYGRPFHGFEDWLWARIELLRPDLIVYEAPLSMLMRGEMVGGELVIKLLTNPETVRMLVGLAALVEAAAWRARVRLLEAHLSTVRKRFTGNGRAKKPEVTARCHALGWAVEDDNQADACAIWAVARGMRDPGFAAAVLPAGEDKAGRRRRRAQAPAPTEAAA